MTPSYSIGDTAYSIPRNKPVTEEVDNPRWPGDTGKIKEVDEFLRDAREQYSADRQADQIDREEAEDDNKFANASDAQQEQWDLAQRQRRIDMMRPVVQWNRIPTFIQQIANASREANPAIKISAGDGGTRETADFFRDRIREIEYECDASIAYDTARDQQITSGRSAIRVSWEYIQGTFDKQICIEPIENQFSVVWDRAAKKYDRSDAERVFVIEWISKARHEREYGEYSTIAQMDFTGTDNPAPGWIGVGPKGELIQRAEYWVKEFTPRILCWVAPEGSPESARIPAWKDELPEGMEAWIVSEREEQDVTICQYMINGAEILSETTWIGSSIPIVPLWGRCAVVDGRRRTFSLIRNAKEPQRILNYEVSNLVEEWGQMPKTPWMVPIGAIPAHLEPDWRDIGSVPKGYLLYNAWDSNGRQLPPPKREVTPPAIQAYVVAIQQASDAIKAAMGIFDAAIGARSNETSGIAIERRRHESNVANLHFSGNEARSRKRIGEIIIELIPKIDKPGKSVPIRSEDGKVSLVPIGKPYRHPKTGQEITHNLEAGDYGVTVSTGRSYDSARQESNERYADIIKAVPELMGVMGDLLLRSDDFPASEDAADRLERWIGLKSPGLIDEKSDGPPIPPQVQQEMLQLQQKATEMEAFAKKSFEDLQAKKPEIESKERMQDKELAFKDKELQSKERIELAKLGSKEAVIELQTDTKRIEGQVSREDSARQAAESRAHESEQAEASRQHEADQAEASRIAAAQSQEGQQAHATEMADIGHQQALEQQEQAAELKPEPREPAE